MAGPSDRLNRRIQPIIIGTRSLPVSISIAGWHSAWGRGRGSLAVDATIGHTSPGLRSQKLARKKKEKETLSAGSRLRSWMKKMQLTGAFMCVGWEHKGLIASSLSLANLSARSILKPGIGPTVPCWAVGRSRPPAVERVTVRPVGTCRGGYQLATAPPAYFRGVFTFSDKARGGTSERTPRSCPLQKWYKHGE
jgi:hypothetical protein